MSLLKELMEGKRSGGKLKMKDSSRPRNADLPKNRNHVAQHMRNVQNGDGAHEAKVGDKAKRAVQKNNLKKELKDQGY